MRSNFFKNPNLLKIYKKIMFLFLVFFLLISKEIIELIPKNPSSKEVHYD